jgi:TolA-binding protein
MDETALAALFKKRWSAVVGLQRGPFELTLDEERALFGFLLAHPATAQRSAQEEGASTARPRAQRQAGVPGAGAPAAAMRAADARRAEERYRLKKIDELAAIDPLYPRHLARGVVLYRLGEYLQAVEAFRSHLDEHPDGPHTLRARNYLRAALGRVVDAPL